MPGTPNDEGQPEQPTTRATPATPPGPQPDAGVAGLPAASQNLADAVEKMRARRKQVEDEQAGQQHADGDEPAVDYDAEFAAIVQGFGAGQDPDDGPTGDEELAKLLQILRRAGADGMKVEQLLTELGKVGHQMSRATLYRRLTKAGDQVRKVGGDNSGRWAAADKLGGLGQ